MTTRLPTVPAHRTRRASRLAAALVVLPLGCVLAESDANQDALALLAQAADAYLGDGPLNAVYRIASSPAATPMDPPSDPADWSSRRVELHVAHDRLLVAQRPWDAPREARNERRAQVESWALALLPGRSESYDGMLDILTLRSLPPDPQAQHPPLYQGSHAPCYLTPFCWLAFAENDMPQVDGTRLNPGMWRDAGARHALIATADQRNGWTWKRQGDGFSGTRRIGTAFIDWNQAPLAAAPDDQLFDLEVHLAPAGDGLPARVTGYQLTPRTTRTWGFAISVHLRALDHGTALMDEAWWRTTPQRIDAVHVTLESLSQRAEDLPTSWHLDPRQAKIVYDDTAGKTVDPRKP